MTNLLVVSEQLWPEGGGGTLATNLIINFLSQSDGIEAVVVSGTKNPARIINAKYISTPLLRTSNKVQLWTKLAYLARRKWFKELLVSSDVVYVPRYCYPLIPLAQKLGKRVVVHLHDCQVLSYNAAVLYNSCGRRGDMFETARDVIRFELLEHHSTVRALLSTLFIPVNRLSRAWVSEADDILCVSHNQREIIGSAMPELADRLEVVCNPLPKVSLTEKRLKDPTIMYLGGDSYVKGFHIFLRASVKLLKRDRGVKFLLAGSLKHAKNVSLIEKLNITFKKAFTLFDHLKHEKVLNLHSVSHALLFPSILKEPLPYAVLESMLSRTVPVASKLGGVPEIVEGSFAEKMLFEPYDVDGCIDRVESLLAMSNEQIKDVGFDLRDVALKKFNLEATKKKLIKVFLS